MGIVVTGARELCEAVETVGAGCRDFVMCRGQRGEVCVPGVRFAGARLAEGNNPGVWIEGRVLLAEVITNHMPRVVRVRVYSCTREMPYRG